MCDTVRLQALAEQAHENACAGVIQALTSGDQESIDFWRKHRKMTRRNLAQVRRDVQFADTMDRAEQALERARAVTSW